MFHQNDVNTAIMKEYSFKSFKFIAFTNSAAWVANLYQGNNKIATVEESGLGGEIKFTFLTKVGGHDKHGQDRLLKKLRDVNFEQALFESQTFKGKPSYGKDCAERGLDSESLLAGFCMLLSNAITIKEDMKEIDKLALSNILYGTLDEYVCLGYDIPFSEFKVRFGETKSKVMLQSCYDDAKKSLTKYTNIINSKEQLKALGINI